MRSGLFYMLPEVSLKALEELFRARVITFLMDKGLLPPQRARMLRGQREKRAAEEAKIAGQAVEIIDVSEHKPRRITSAKWRELIKKVWEADPLLCPKCQKEMRIVALIDDRELIERILRHFGLWEQGVGVLPARAPPELADRVIEPWLDDPFPDYDVEPVMMYANG